MKKILIIIIVIILGFIIKIPEYEELNTLAIIEGAGISYNDEIYTIYLKEVIPIKDDQGMSYKYDYYKGEGKTISKALEKLKDNANKKIYLKRCKFIVTNLKYSNEIIKVLNIKPNNIYHQTKDIYKKLEKTES